MLGAQGAIQASNLLTGLLILRFLGVREYAIYAIAGTLIGVGAVLANLSLYPATSHQVARAADDRARLNAIVSTAWLL
jgi:O-antigen/teichoic acid export membrane protein